MESFCHFGMFHSSGVISLFSKSQHISSHLLYYLFISLLFPFPTLFFLYLTHLIQFFLISVPKRNISTTMERREYYVFLWCKYVGPTFPTPKSKPSSVFFFFSFVNVCSSFYSRFFGQHQLLISRFFFCYTPK